MMRQKKTRLFYELLVFLLPFIVVSIAVTGVLLSVTNNNFFQKTIHQDYINITRRAAGEIRLFMKHSRQDLETLAQIMAAVNLSAWQKEIAMTVFMHNNPAFTGIDLYSDEREKIISVTADAISLDADDAALLMRAIEGQPVISGKVRTDDDLIYMNIAIPVFHLGKVAAVLFARLNLKFIWDVLENITIGKAGQIYILDTSGRFIAHKDIQRVFKRSPFQHLEILKEIHDTGIPSEWIGHTGGIRSYNLGIYIPDLAWVLILNQPFREVYAYLFQNFFWALGVTVLLSLLAFGFAWRRSRRFLKPIYLLHRQVQEISRGNLDRKVTIKTNNEIAELGIAFNQMTESLKQYIAREIETTRALAHAKNLALLGMTAGKVAHEVGNFITKIQMILSSVEKVASGQGSQPLIEIIKNDSADILSFTQAFLDFARKPKLSLQNWPMDDFIQTTLDIFKEVAADRGIEFTMDWGPAIPLICMDAALMGQVLNNLIKNSMEAMPGAGSIGIRGRLENSDLIISFKDTGEGIAAKHMEKIFEPFFTTKEGKGNGLGMAIVKSHIEIHGGTIECFSEPGQGTEFVIRMPVAQSMDQKIMAR